jgi:hypothetical protein
MHSRQQYQNAEAESVSIPDQNGPMKRAGLLAAAALRMIRRKTPVVAGHWERAIELPGTRLDVRVDLAQTEGYWTGSATRSAFRDFRHRGFRTPRRKRIQRLSCLKADVATVAIGGTFHERR